jgi:hypothetical protein
MRSAGVSGMTAVKHVAYAGAEDQGERQAIQLADRLRALAATDPDLAQDLVDRLIIALDQATDGLFTEHIDSAAVSNAAGRDRMAPLRSRNT